VVGEHRVDTGPREDPELAHLAAAALPNKVRGDARFGSTPSKPGAGLDSCEAVGRTNGDSVADWGDLVAYIRHSYDVIHFEPDQVRIRVSFGQDDEDLLGRRQIMVVAHEILDQREDWVQIATPFARVEQVDLHEVLTEVGNTIVVGGVALMGDYVVLRHSLPLINLDINEFTDPLDLVASGAEQLERRFTGRDDY
jgi:hypothetical protein